MESLLSEYNLSLKAWRLSVGTSIKGVRDCLINMRKVFIQKVIVITSATNAEMLLDEVSYNILVLCFSVYRLRSGHGRSWIFKTYILICMAYQLFVGQSKP